MTRRKYLARLRAFFTFIGIEGTIQEQCNKFVESARCDSKSISISMINTNDDGWALQHITSFLRMQRDRVDNKEITSTTAINNIKTVKLFCEVNNVLQIPWKNLTRGFPKGRRAADDRAPTIEEIRKIAEYPDRRIKSIVYTTESGGIRLGAWDFLKWGHIIPIERNGEIVAAKMRVYVGEYDEYFTFITPEAYKAIEEWIDFRRRAGETITKDSWVMRNLWNTVGTVKYTGHPAKEIGRKGWHNILDRFSNMDRWITYQALC